MKPATLWLPLSLLAATLSLSGCSSKDEEQETVTEKSELSLGDLKVKTEENGKSTISFGNEGSMTSGAEMDEDTVGVPFYPGSKQLKDSTFSMETAEVKTLTVQFESDDDPEAVAGFYKKKLGKPEMEMTVNATTTLSYSKDKESLVISAERNEDKKTIIYIQKHLDLKKG